MNRRQIVEGCKRGDPASVEALYKVYSAKLMGICRHYVSSRDVAEDLFHDAFLVILSSIGSLRNPDKLEAWMGVIVKNIALDYLKDSKHFTHPDTDMEMEDVLEESVYPVPPYEDMMAMIDRLPEQYGKVFRLSILEGLSHKEIGALLHIGERSSSSNLFRARQFLQKELKQYWLALMALIVLVATPFILHKRAGEWPEPEQPIAINTGFDTTDIQTGVDSSAVVPVEVVPEKTFYAREVEPETKVERVDSMAKRTNIIPVGRIEGLGLQAIVTGKTPTLSIRKPEQREWTVPEDWLSEARKPDKKSVLGLFPSISVLPGAIAGTSPIIMGSGILADASSYIMAPDTKVDNWSDFLEAVRSMEGSYTSGDSLAYYNSLLHIAEGLASPVAMDQNPMPVEERVEYEKPFSVGLSASIGLNDRWSVLTGLEYTRLASSHTIGRDTLYIRNQQKIHYVGVPLGLSYTVWSKGNLRLNASAFGKMEIPVAATINQLHHNGNAYTYRSSFRIQAPVQWSAGAGFGLQYNVLPWMGLYVEPQVRYYFDTGGNIQTIRQAQPVEFAVPFGVRLTF